jgi:hypothetical protein
VTALEATLAKASMVAMKVLEAGQSNRLTTALEAAPKALTIALKAALNEALMAATVVLRAALNGAIPRMEAGAEKKTAVEKCWKGALQSCNEHKMERQGS